MRAANYQQIVEMLSPLKRASRLNDCVIDRDRSALDRGTSARQQFAESIATSIDRRERIRERGSQLVEEIQLSASRSPKTPLPGLRIESEAETESTNIARVSIILVSRSTPVVGATANLSDVSRIFSRERFDRFPPN